MSDMSDYLEDALVRHVLLGVPYTAPAGKYLALFTTMPDDDGTGGVEVSGGSYARQLMSFATSGITGTVRSSGAETFTNLPACTVVGGALYDAATNGNMLMKKTLGSPITYTAGTSATLADEAITFTLA